MSLAGEPALELRMKVRRRPGVNGEKVSSPKAVLAADGEANQGGTAEMIRSFGPLSEMTEDRMTFLFFRAGYPDWKKKRLINIGKEKDYGKR